MRHRFIAATALASISVLSLAGCVSGDSNVFPSPDPTLRKSPEQFKAYAATTTYPADLPREKDSPIRAEIDYQLDVINMVNLGDVEWTDIDVWVNERYVVKISALPLKQQRAVNFHQLYDKDGVRAPSSGVFVEKLELQYDGKMYPVRARAAD